MADVFTVLAGDHEEVKQMLTELEAGSADASAASVRGEDGRRRRGEMVERLVIEESKHEAVEEEYFWPAVRELVEDGDRLADRAVEQEQSAKRTLDELMRLDAGDPRFEELLANLITDGRAHIAFEETTVWPALRRVISDERAERLGEKLAHAKKTAPTRPHPHTPPKPGVLKAAGPAVAAADRLRDKITGRGRT
ncbi:MAG TPA: hemerythrin domain-containing protein [Spirillospora sp.]|nr:hemerythrin domain-containing protein [Spirillospora sp.]